MGLFLLAFWLRSRKAQEKQGPLTLRSWWVQLGTQTSPRTDGDTTELGGWFLCPRVKVLWACWCMCGGVPTPLHRRSRLPEMYRARWMSPARSCSWVAGRQVPCGRSCLEHRRPFLEGHGPMPGPDTPAQYSVTRGTGQAPWGYGGVKSSPTPTPGAESQTDTPLPRRL